MLKIFKNKYFIFHIMLFINMMTFAQQIPDRPVPPRLVNDFTHTLTSSQLYNLEEKLRIYHDTTSTQIAVVFINDLQGTTASDFSYRIGEKWGVGSKENNGVIILIKPKTEDSRGEAFINVGYGLEPYIPDAIAKHIVENEMIPAFKEMDYYKGVNNAVNIIIGLASGAFTAEDYSGNDDASMIVFLVFILIIMIVVIRFSRHSSTTYSSKNDSSTRKALFLGSLLSSHNRHNNWGGFSGSSGGFGGGGTSFGGFGGGHFGGGGAGGSW